MNFRFAIPILYDIYLHCLLGWDVSNNKGNDERRKEVAQEKESTDEAIDRLVY